ncbi:AAA family ATPase [Phormidium sp. LEGE 05292]|uniref:trifunctional serine/threonine-protein kinase/ATP-binding protein/sensor histidine kinase n=1 Tax=[Phormidium] sp. LEGE 05292 TaxID=767427 RepID=UPI00188122CF|nr:ATP-binding sensor histidine kinase [Phormidium sp. LEGE 05292]MBE9227626.1 AAA family ATPase [Phormidium sp. LEGE 05292]
MTAISLMIPGYSILEIIQDGDETVVYRAQRQIDLCPVVIKLSKAEYPSLELVTRLKHEYRVSRNLQFPGVVQALSLENHQHRFALVVEDFGGISLKRLLENGPLSIASFLPIAIQIVMVIAQIHEQGVIHKDIKPSNIIINPIANEVKITDFGIASLLSRGVAAIATPECLEGTLPYMSPEQTGRMNRAVDYRSDFYSLGISFYEMLTGVLPYQSYDPLELIHHHIAKSPLPPHTLNSEIPEVISAIVLKLMAKTAEDRYQSARGLEADLEKCLHQLQTTGKIETFIPGEIDAASQLLLPQKLYGREADIASLMAAFARVAGIGKRGELLAPSYTEANYSTNNGLLPDCANSLRHSQSELVLVSGYSGIGKSSLVNEVHKPITKQRGYFIAGKFDQFNRNIPYSALIQAFQGLVRQLLAEGNDRLKMWREQLSIAISPNGQILVEMIPEIELLIGEQPPVAELSAIAAQNRFNQVFQAFVRVLAQPKHPLVIFLDDLQWADLASLRFLQLLMTDSESQYLMVIGAYRDNEVSPEHPLVQTVEKIKTGEILVTELHLKPLAQQHVREFIVDTLHEAERTKPLTDLLFNKTQGNPFFLSQLLKSLYQEELIHFDFMERRWLWDLEQIQKIGITDRSVVDLVITNILKLPEATQRILKDAACIGNTFSLETLAVVRKQSLLDTADELWAALQAGLVLPVTKDYKALLVNDENSDVALALTNNNIVYKFLHDRVQQAAYCLIPIQERQATHLEIGRQLLKSPYHADKLFDIVSQLNIGISLITDAAEQRQLAELNLEAGRRAKASLAYTVAMRCLEKGLQLLAAEGWQQDYELTLALHEEATQAAFLNNEFDRARELAEITLKQGKTLLEQARVYELLVQFYLAQNQMSEAIATARHSLNLLGVSLCNELPNISDLQNLLTLPEMTDPYKLAAMRILCSVVDASAGTPDIFRQVVLTMVQLCVEYGNSRYSAYAYMVYGWLLCGGLEDPKIGYQFSKLALDVLAKYNAQELRCKIVEIFSAFVQHWQEPLSLSIQPLEDEIQGCLEVGNKDYACFCAMHYACYLTLVGEPLEIVQKKQQIYADMIAKMQRDLQLTYTQIWQQMVANLLGQASDPTLLIGSYLDESKVLPKLFAENGSFSIFAIYVVKTQLAYLFKQYDRAVENAQRATEHEIKAGIATTGSYHFYTVLSLLAYSASLNESERTRYQSQIDRHLNYLRFRAIETPANYQHKYDLVQAEIARMNQKLFEAMELYDRAIAGAKANGYLQEKALSYELAGEFYLSLNRLEIAKTYLINACYRYAQWDALAKVRDLEARYPELLAILSSKKTLAGNQKTHTTSTSRWGSSSTQSKNELDLSTVVKASQALSGEIILSKLLERFIQLAIENVGAQRGVFLSREDNNWVIESEGSIELEKFASIRNLPLEEQVPLSTIAYVERIKNHVVLDNIQLDSRFNQDPYVISQQPKSVLCFPILHKKELMGMLYLENSLVMGAFTQSRLEILKVLTSQAAISIENSRLYTDLQTYSKALEIKNQALEEKTAQLETTLKHLQNTQAQLVQTEKISSLGQLVAGVAHEVNNPVSFIAGNLDMAKQYTQDLLMLVNLYQQYLPNPPQEIQDAIEEIDLEYLQEDLPKLLSSMQVGTHRIRGIMSSLRTFSRTDSDRKQPADLHEGLESTLLILHHRLKAKDFRPEIKLIKEYGDLPKVLCFPGQLNQVFMNILANGIDAIDECSQGRSYKELQQNPFQIRIRTELQDQQVIIAIGDNGCGISPEVQERLFDPFFTTKSAGKGTGLGLSISYQIVTEKHGGSLECVSMVGLGSEFIIKIPVN